MAYANVTKANESKRSPGDIVDLPVADNVIIYKGTIVVIDTSGYANIPSDAAGLKFAGIAYETVDNTITGHTAGGLRIRVYQEGIFSLENVDVDFADMGTYVYADLTATGTPKRVTKTATGSTNKMQVGVSVSGLGHSSDSEIRVKIDRAIGYVSVAN